MKVWIPVAPESGAAVERADAARNRARILDCATRIAERCPEEVTMPRVAREAGVGVGTVYRRFGDRDGLVQALLDADEREFQSGYLFGPAPLGPVGEASAKERVRAFVHALAARTFEQSKLRAQLTDATRLSSAPAAAWMCHLQVLLCDTHAPGEAAVLAHALVTVCLPASLSTLAQLPSPNSESPCEAIHRSLDTLVDLLA